MPREPHFQTRLELVTEGTYAFRDTANTPRLRFPTRRDRNVSTVFAIADREVSIAAENVGGFGFLQRARVGPDALLVERDGERAGQSVAIDDRV